MNKKYFGLITVMAFACGCSMHGSSNDGKIAVIESDTFVEEFLENLLNKNLIKNNETMLSFHNAPKECLEKFLNIDKNIQYNDRKLTLYNAPNDAQMIISILGLIAGLLAGADAASYKYVEHVRGIVYRDAREKVPALTVISTLLILICGYLFYDDYRYRIEKVPLITLLDQGICFNGEFVRWNNVYKVESEARMCSYSGACFQVGETIRLCDKYFNSLLRLERLERHLPISTGNLRALIERYVERNQEKRKCAG
ncbi:MAG: hypothetical protein WCT20_03100 [Candidatus Babeliales bacterium]